MVKILIVDDEIDLCEILKFNLENLGYTVDTANSAEEALQLDISSYSLLLLDVMMDKMSGFAMAALLKKEPATAAIPIIFVTAKDTENDTLTGFNIGADDYISKPFRLSEVAARVKAVLRRTEQIAARGQNPAASVAPTEESHPSVCYEDLELNVDAKRALLEGQDLALTRKEYELLLLLLSNRGRIYSREQILQKIWPDDVMVLERSVDVNIARLRKKLGPYAEFIVSRSGYGYSFKD